ncbi:unnamed protein product [Heligmosomoides polygyrus]|uniref:Secreted protein n=1 Tax=Heligmosomoides polygyrus TaxID=6339 RepID=A0A183G3I8_HELPZ|nr:unnamed protein product [Heligmosomoides polygyrus]
MYLFELEYVLLVVRDSDATSRFASEASSLFQLCMWQGHDRWWRCLLVLCGLLPSVIPQIQQAQSGNINQNIGQPDSGTLFTGTGSNVYYGGEADLI